MDIQQPATIAESRKAPIVVGSGDWLEPAVKSMKGRSSDTIFCGDMAKIPNAPDCCADCHEDWNEGYYNPEWREPDKTIPHKYCLCCAMRLFAETQAGSNGGR
jgi:hypothetical protein